MNNYLASSIFLWIDRAHRGLLMKSTISAYEVRDKVSIQDSAENEWLPHWQRLIQLD